jgi:hypothetical protein
MGLVCRFVTHPPSKPLPTTIWRVHCRPASIDRGPFDISKRDACRRIAMGQQFSHKGQLCDFAVPLVSVAPMKC